MTGSELAAAPAQAPTQAFERPSRKRHLAFCRAVAMGEPGYAAYRKYCSKFATLRTGMEQSARFISRWGDYIQHIRSKLLDKADNAAIAGKLELLQRDSRTLRTPAIVAADPESDLAKVIVTISATGERTTRVEGPDKDAAAARLAKIQGLDAPQQVNHTHTLLDSPALAMLDGRMNKSATRLDLKPEQGVIEAELVPVESIRSTEDCEISQAWSAPSQLESGAGQEQ